VSRAATIGERERVAGYALAGIEVLAAEGPTEVERAWEGLSADIVLLLLTPMAERALRPRRRERPELLWAVLP
jgi:vacuolar-type H+-ATPase subunit F/Vma7